ncbi:hypothetical protein [Microbacterium sp. NPDC087589]|uniref:hypothetical protein n=1 Tax=Microbacterium sp. NPDC087589 TaxID=3364191 RepID=UPI0038131987
MDGLVAATVDESEVLRSEMRDLQRAASQYYAATGHFGSQEEMGVQSRSFLGHAQRLNDLLTNKLADRATYVALTGSTSPHPHPQRDLIEGMKYARNVVEHVMYILKPAEPNAMFGSSDIGFRLVAEWDEIPPHVHAELRPSTQKLKPHYDKHFRDRNVMTVMFEILRFFAEVVPDAVHRDQSGEWTGFPLQAQLAVPAPLHPEEPLDSGHARAWLDARLPNGNIRVVGGQITVGGTQYVVGLTFTSDLTFGHFVETASQVDADIAAGYSYVQWTGTPDFEDLTAQFPQFLTGKVYRALTAFPEWTTPFDPAIPTSDWHLGHQLEEWEQIVRAEALTHVSDHVAYVTRRARRLYAFYPLYP